MIARWTCAHAYDWARAWWLTRGSKKYSTHFVILVAAYNNVAWYRRTLKSIFAQKYQHYRVLYIDDASTDGSCEQVKVFVQARGYNDRMTFVCNNINVGATANRFYGSRSCANDEVVVVLDGDDWFAHPYVLAILANAYADPRVWLTYGQFRRWPSGVIGQCRALSPDYNYRIMPHWYTSHVRTYRSWLFRQVTLEDVQHEGRFFDVAGDVAEMLPLLELGRGHSVFIPSILYIYNCANPTSDFACKLERQIALSRLIQSRQTKKCLSRPKTHFENL